MPGMAGLCYQKRGAWQCGAGIPVCPRRRAQTGMSAPHWRLVRRYPSIPVDTCRLFRGLEDEDEKALRSPPGSAGPFSRHRTSVSGDKQARSTHLNPHLNSLLIGTLTPPAYSFVNWRLILADLASWRFGSFVRLAVTPRSGVTGTARPTFRSLYRELMLARLTVQPGIGRTERPERGNRRPRRYRSPPMRRINTPRRPRAPRRIGSERGAGTFACSFAFDKA